LRKPVDSRLKASRFGYDRTGRVAKRDISFGYEHNPANPGQRDHTHGIGLARSRHASRLRFKRDQHRTAVGCRADRSVCADGLGDDVTAGITLSSVAQEVQLTGPLTKTAPATVAGGPVIGVEATPPAADDMPAAAKMVLYITERSPLRPVQFELVGDSSTKSGTSFSQWGETLHLTAPANAVPASTITPVSSTA
jgi:hypothetical protein